MDGLASITARVSEIQSQIATLTGALSAPSQVSASRAPDPTSGSTSTSGTTFASALADAVSQTNTSTPTTTGTAPVTATPGTPGVLSGRLNANGVPADLARYGNGRIPASALRPISGTRHRLWAPASVSFEALLQAAKRDGIHIGITDSYRSYAEQVDLVRRKGLYSRGGLAAAPGTSNHGWGRAVDLALNGQAQAWMRTHAAQFGFHNDVPRESWHWDYIPKNH